MRRRELCLVVGTANHGSQVGQGASSSGRQSETCAGSAGASTNEVVRRASSAVLTPEARCLKGIAVRSPQVVTGDGVLHTPRAHMAVQNHGVIYGHFRARGNPKAPALPAKCRLLDAPPVICAANHSLEFGRISPAKMG